MQFHEVGRPAAGPGDVGVALGGFLIAASVSGENVGLGSIAGRFGGSRGRRGWRWRGRSREQRDDRVGCGRRRDDWSGAGGSASSAAIGSVTGAGLAAPDAAVGVGVGCSVKPRGQRGIRAGREGGLRARSAGGRGKSHEDAQEEFGDAHRVQNSLPAETT